MPADFRYTPFYCEENIWYLAQQKRFSGQQSLVVIISGKGSHRKLWFQSQADNPALPVCWDYHVILLSFDRHWQVWDLDTSLGLPVSADTYFSKTFLQSGIDVHNCDVVLRLIESADYLRHFSSDRSHMRLQSGVWLARPPEWPAILPEKKSNLLDWIDIARDEPGRVLTLAEFINNFPVTDSRNRTD